MALLKSLEICGIRNFSPDNQQIVYFQTPVVLFQGPNGSGKTTILESIRYSLTGELPGGTTSGQGFVNEPKMSSKNSTKGSIKIKFVDPEGNIITVCRVVQVHINTKGSLQFKKLNNSVRKKPINDPNNVQDISGRCLDIDNFCCTSLNVSKSIFNNVLFCHQENSLWPLDEPQKLKDKFDEIFDAIKYKKCIDSIRKYLKERQSDIKLLQERLDGRKCIKNHVDRQRDKLEVKKDKLSEIKKNIEQKNNELQPLDDKLKDIFALELSLDTLERKLSGKQEEKNGLQNQQRALQKDISYIFEGSDKELEAKVAAFRENEASEEYDIRQKEKNIQEINKQMTSINLNIQNKQVKIGQLKEEQNQYNKRTEEYKTLLDKLRTELDVEQSENKDNLLGDLTEALNHKESEFKKLINEKDAEENQLQSKMDTLRENNAKMEQSIISKNGYIRECQNKLREIRNKLDELDSSDTQLKTITNKVETFQSTLKKLKDSFNENEKILEIQELKESIERKEQYLEKLDRDNRVLQRNYATEQKIESENNLISEKQGQINRILSKHSRNLKTLFGEDVPKKNLRKSVLDIQNAQETELKTRTKSVNSLEMQHTTLKTSLNHLSKTLKTLQQELATNSSKIKEVCKEDKKFKEVLEQSYRKKEKLQRDKAQCTAAKIMYEKFVENVEEKSCCPVCKTNFKNNQSAISEVIGYLRSKINNIPSKAEVVEAELKKEEITYNELLNLKAVNDEIETLKNVKIPNLESDISRVNEEFEDKTMELAGEQHSLQKPQELADICKNLITDAALFDQYNTDIIKATGNIDELEQSIESVPSNRSRQETEMEIDSVKGELSNIKNRYETNKNLLESHKDRCQDINKKIQTEVQKQLDLQRLIQERPGLELQNREYNEKILVLKTETEELKIQLSAVKDELRDAVEHKKNVTKLNTEIKHKTRNSIISYHNSMRDINKIQKLIKEYEGNKNNEKLISAVDNLAELKVDLQNLEKNKSEALESITTIKESVAKKESELRALKDNVTLRKIREKEMKVVAEITELERQIGGYNKLQLFKEKQTKSAEIHKKQMEISIQKGQKEEIQKSIDELEEDLRKPENKNAHDIYKKAYYNLHLKLLALEDLKKYATVLERCVLKFHEERMVQINLSIRNLWRTIYRGNDIDYIEIKTDENMTGGVGKRRAYTYKVIQVKNGIELDMRGRCSAGQKVLACLVIRMALAETFSAHCGILALDEPTTNLDKANISSLSDALSELINSRQGQSNFQLLIITHDEEFLRSLTQTQSLESYWQVKRNHAGNSVVEKQML